MLLKIVIQFVEAGLSPREAFSVLMENGDAKMRRLALNVEKSLSGGATLSAALNKAACGFNDIALALMASGEAVGQSLSALKSALQHMERTQSFRTQLTTSLRYPFLVLMALCVSVYCLKIFLFPHIEALSASQKGSSSFATESLMWILKGDIFESWPLMLLITLVMLTIVWVILSLRGRFLWHRFVLKMPGVASIILATRWSCFFYLTSLSLRTSLTLPASLDLAIGVLDYLPLKKRAQRAQRAVFEGQNLSVSLRHAPGLLPEAYQMMYAGERAGNLGIMCGHIGDVYEARLKRYQDAAQAYVGPMMLFVLALLFMWVIQGAVMPLYDHLGDFSGGVSP